MKHNVILKNNSTNQIPPTSVLISTLKRWLRQCSLNHLCKLPGSVLASQDPAVLVLSALEGLTVVFGMGTGVSPPPWPPDFSPADAHRSPSSPSVALSVTYLFRTFPHSLLQFLGSLAPLWRSASDPLTWLFAAWL